MGGVSTGLGDGGGGKAKRRQFIQRKGKKRERDAIKKSEGSGGGADMRRTDATKS